MKDSGIRLEELARLAGVSKTTVCDALNNRPRVAKHTRERIQQLAAEHGYHPDPMVRALARHRWKSGPVRARSNLALVHDLDAERRRYFERAVQKLRATASRLGYVLMEFGVEKGTSGAQFRKMLDARGVLGLILGPANPMAHLPGLDLSGLAVINCKSSAVVPGVPGVMYDLQYAVCRACEEIAHRGYQRPAAAFVRSGSDRIDTLRNGLYRQCCWERGWEPLIYRDVDGSYEKGEDVEAWVRAQRPDVLLALNDRTYWILREAGWRMPEDLGFVSLAADVNGTSSSGMSQAHERVAELTVVHLDTLIRERAFGLADEEQSILVTGKWIEGTSVRARLS